MHTCLHTLTISLLFVHVSLTFQCINFYFISYGLLFADPEFQQQTTNPVFKEIKSRLPTKITKHTAKQCKPKVVSVTKFPPGISASKQYDHRTVKTVNDDLRSIFIEELLVFVDDQSKQTLDYPTTLSSLQRKVLHEVCLRVG